MNVPRREKIAWYSLNAWRSASGWRASATSARPGSAYAAQFPDQHAVPGTPIPTLIELFDLVRQSGDKEVRFNIETKSFPEKPEYTPPPAEFQRAADT